MNKNIRIQYLTGLLCLTALTGGCAVGPDYEAPKGPSVAGYTQGVMPLQTEGQPTSSHGGVQRFLMGGEVPAAWWTLYESPSLTHLISLAVKFNPSLDAARAALVSAQETAQASAGNFFPQIDGDASDRRSKASGTTKPYSLYNTSVSVSYIPDVFGSTRRTVESLEAATEAKNFELEAAYLSLTSNVVTTAIQEASLKDQIAATKEIIASQEKQLELMRTQFDAGAITKQDVLSQESTVASTKAALPALEQQLAAQRHLLAVLLGQFPSENVPATFELSALKLPTEIPVSLPSRLVEQRPDIRAAEANLKAANANVGIAMAAMFPQITLTGSYGVSAARIGDLFSPTTALWGLAAGLAQPLFHGGELLHTKRAKEASYDQAAAQYRATVLSAFQDVANTLKALEADAQILKSRSDAEAAAAQALELTTSQFNAGAVSYINLLVSQAAYQQAKIALIQAKAARLSDTAALFQALGGGWWQRGTSLTKETP